MSLPDLVNGCFEAFGGLFVLNHCRVLYKDKAVRGISVLSTVFFLSWGIWNLYYYPHLGQWLSFAGGLFIVIANVLWCYLLIYYKWFYKHVPVEEQLAEKLAGDIRREIDQEVMEKMVRQIKASYTVEKGEL